MVMFKIVPLRVCFISIFTCTKQTKFYFEYPINFLDIKVAVQLHVKEKVDTIFFLSINNILAFSSSLCYLLVLY